MINATEKKKKMIVFMSSLQEITEMCSEFQQNGICLSFFFLILHFHQELPTLMTVDDPVKEGTFLEQSLSGIQGDTSSIQEQSGGYIFISSFCSIHTTPTLRACKCLEECG